MIDGPAQLSRLCRSGNNVLTSFIPEPYVLKPDAIDFKSYPQRESSGTRSSDGYCRWISLRVYSRGCLTACWPELVAVIRYFGRYRTDWIRNGMLLVDE